MLVVPNRAPDGRRRSPPRRPPTQPIELDLAAQATDPDGDTLYFACCDQPHGGSATTLANGAGQLRVTFTPDAGFAGPATFAYAVDDQQGHTVAGAVTIDVLAPANRPPVATDTTLAVEAGTPTNIDLAALVTDPDAGDQLTFAISGPAEGAVTLSQSRRQRAGVGADRRRRPHRLVHLHGHRLRRPDAPAARSSLTVRPPAAPPPQARNDAATTNQGQPVTVAVLANDIDPLGRGLTSSSVGAVAGRHRRRPTASRSRSRRAADFFGAAVVHLPGPRRRQHGRAPVRGAGRRHRHRPAVGARHAGRRARATRRRPSTGRPRRPTGRRSTTTSCASTAARAARSARRPPTRGTA